MTKMTKSESFRKARNIKNGPFIYQSVFAIRKIRENIPAREFTGVLTIYVVLCEISNTYHNPDQGFDTYISSVATQARVSEKSCLKYLTYLAQLELILFPPQERSSDGRFAKRRVKLLDFEQKSDENRRKVIPTDIEDIVVEPSASTFSPSVSSEKVLGKFMESLGTKLTGIKKNLIEESIRKILIEESVEMNTQDLNFYVDVFTKKIQTELRKKKDAQPKNYLQKEDYLKAIRDEKILHQIGSQINLHPKIVKYYLEKINNWCETSPKGKYQYLTFEDTIKNWNARDIAAGYKFWDLANVHFDLRLYSAYEANEIKKAEAKRYAQAQVNKNAGFQKIGSPAKSFVGKLGVLAEQATTVGEPFDEDLF